MKKLLLLALAFANIDVASAQSLRHQYHNYLSKLQPGDRVDILESRKYNFFELKIVSADVTEARTDIVLQYTSGFDSQEWQYPPGIKYAVQERDDVGDARILMPIKIGTTEKIACQEIATKRWFWGTIKKSFYTKGNVPGLVGYNGHKKEIEYVSIMETDEGKNSKEVVVWGYCQLEPRWTPERKILDDISNYAVGKTVKYFNHDKQKLKTAEIVGIESNYTIKIRLSWKWHWNQEYLYIPLSDVHEIY
jgi:hypothetical protein